MEGYLCDPQCSAASGVWVKQVLHTLASEPKSHSEALETAMASAERRAAEAPSPNFRQLFFAVLHDIATQRPNSNP